VRLLPDILEVNSVSKRFGGVVALQDVSVRVPERGVVGLIGPNGSGKTTLFNVVTGFYVPDKGEVWFHNGRSSERIDGLNPNEVFARGIVRTFQIPRLFKSLTVLENLLLTPFPQRGEGPLRALSLRAWVEEERALARRALELLKRFGLLEYANVRVSELSGAHMKLVETIRGLMTPAKLFLLDEPAAGVEATVAHDLFRLVRELNSNGYTFLIVEHRIEILMQYVDYVYVLHNGQLLAEGKPEEIVTNEKVVEAYIGETRGSG
jgi:branched-chain amino acid transport system ATP-binding protein